MVITSYVLYAIGLQTMAKREEVIPDWLAWIPILNWYVIAEIVREKPMIKSGKRFTLITLSSLGVYFFLTVLNSLVSTYSVGLSTFINILAFFTLIVAVSYIWLLHYYLLSRYTTNAVLLIVLGVLITDVILCIAVFALRNSPIIGVATDKQKHTNIEE